MAEPTEQEKWDAIESILESYAKVVAMAAGKIRQGGDNGEFLRETIEGMTESQAKQMLIIRIATEASQALEYSEKLAAMQADPDKLH